jgi:hypothetical protein
MDPRGLARGPRDAMDACTARYRNRLLRRRTNRRRRVRHRRGLAVAEAADMVLAIYVLVSAQRLRFEERLAAEETGTVAPLFHPRKPLAPLVPDLGGFLSTPTLATDATGRGRRRRLDMEQPRRRPGLLHQSKYILF